MRRCSIVALFVIAAALAPARAESLTLVACAPGYPGSTEQAQPSMDLFARALERAAGRPEGRFAAVYYNTLDEGLERMRRDDAVVALVPLPLYLEYREELQLQPLLQVIPEVGETDRWSLVARKGAVGAPAALSGWQIAGMPGYSPRFVRDVALGGWGALPDDVEIAFSPRVLSVLRRAARGDDVAALLDRAQGDALRELPFAADLEVVTQSSPLTASVVCSIGERLHADDAEALVAALLGLHQSEVGRELLAEIRMARFEPVPDALAAAEQAFGEPSE